MIKHLVFWNVKEEFEGMKKPEIHQKMKSMLEALPPHIPEIRSLEVGLNFSGRDTAFEIGLNSAFESKEDLATYQNHPEHQKVVAFFKQVTIGSAVLDYEL